MEKDKVVIRPATEADVPLLARNVLDAVGMSEPEEETMAQVTEMCRRTDVLYSWKNTMVAEINGLAVGTLTCYDGVDYSQMREVTFPIIARNSGYDYSDMEMETGPGEFYLDSMAVLPEYRRQGVATALLKAGIARARALGISQASIVVSPDKPDAQRLYESLGFQFQKDMFLFGGEYRKMVRQMEKK